ncbi:MAG: xanthine dehydrogenase family protein molybdopterin-binding subunit [Paracoccaceae bacterium]|nr:xanthine dehydrogenase family protein molybdopterin-binding subunit [Paracoccaceae bacterium]MDE2675861.1 xanthine dehydrogenase family protein molybdopterin-binding subunit [Paracoccaceae bacterium]MYJ86547.1 xanthine dehydrogenase family protein molybdopterin-binding subunit [Paracoccaceae bacterium]
MTVQLTRRTFLQTASATTTLLIGFNGSKILASGHADGEFTPFVRISSDGTITAIIKHFECGQGTATGLSTLIAEELNMDLDQIEIEFAPANAQKYANLFFGMQGTGGSTAMANSYMQYRTAGAAAKEMLIKAAADEWGVSPESISLANGQLSSGGKEASVGEFVAAASMLEVPAKPLLKDPSEFTLIGNPDTNRRDNDPKINGTAQYAMDVHLDGQIVAVFVRSPRFGGTLVSLDDSGAKDIPGFIRTATLPTGTGAIVYAENTWAALQSRDAIFAEWDFSNADNRSSDQIKADLLAAVNRDAEFDARGIQGDAAEGLSRATKVISREFFLPFLAHAPMEPLNCTIAPTETGVMLYDGCQMPSGAQFALGAVLQIPPENVQITTLYAGGSFGRRSSPSADYHVEAALAFALNGGKVPVKLIWSREDDLKGGYYRPAVAHKVQVGLDDDGRIIGWDHRISGKPIFKGSPFEAVVVQNGVDITSVEGVADTLYDIPGLYVGLTDDISPISVNWWRSVGHSHTAFVMESMMDLAAEAAGQDPLEYRLSYLQSGTPDHNRLAGVLKLAGTNAGWGNPLPEGHYQGIAVHKSFGSYAAEVVEVSGDIDNGVVIEKVTCAVDCGLAVNPDVVKAQMESGIGYGIGHVMRNEITFTDGEVDQWNFPDYQPMRINDIRTIEVHIVPSTEGPSGVGEPGTPPSGPALANALASMGTRVTHLPMEANGITFT